MESSTCTLTTVSSTEVIVKTVKSKWIPQVFGAFAATISAFGMGTVEAYTSPGLPSLVESDKVGYLSIDQQSNIASYALLGALLSGPPIGFLIGKVGRKAVLIVLSLPFVTGWLLVAASVNLEMMYLGRFLTGFCAGSASLVVPIFIGEIAEDGIRGMLCSGFQLMVTLGNFFVFLLGAYIEWQWLALVCGMVPLLGLLLMAVVPASPRFLLSRDRVDDARRTLMWFRGTKCSADVEFELNAMQLNVLNCREERKSLKDIFKMRTIRPMFICLLLLFFQQATGIEAVLVFTVYIFSAAGSSVDPSTCTIIVGVLQVIATFLSAIFVDKVGRRSLLFISELGTGSAMLSLGIFFFIKDEDPTLIHRLNWMPLASLGIFIFFFAIGCGPVPFLMVAELNSPAVIGIASAAATTLNWSFAYLVTAFFMNIESEIGLHWCFSIFSGFSFLGALFVYVFVPETKGISMEEIQDYFRTKEKNLP